MKKLLCVLLAVVMLAGLFGFGAGAAVDPNDYTTWPLLTLNQPVDLEFWGYAGGGFDDSGTYPAYMSFYRFIPAESGLYFFEIVGPDSLMLRLVYVTTTDFIGVWADDVLPGAGTILDLEGGEEYLVVAQAIYRVPGSTGTFQVVARKVNTPWWQNLPPFLQFLLRWLAFGWIWMR